MIRNRLLITGFSLFIIMILIAGCGGPAAQTQAPPATNPTEAPVSEQQKAPVVVQYWSNGWIPNSIVSRKQIVDKFNQEYAGKIQVEYVQGSWDDGETYLANGVAAGGGIACVMDWYDAGAQDWFRKGYVKDLTPFITPEIKAFMSDEQWTARSYEGKVVMTGSVMGDPLLTLMYNPAMFEAAGVTPATVDKPWSWDDLFANAKKLTVDVNGNRLGEAGFDSAHVKTWGYVERLDSEKVWENGINFAQMPMGKSIIRQENGRWGWFLDDKGAAAYERYLTPIQAGITPPAAVGLGGDTIEQMLAEGTAAIILRETFAMQEYATNFPDFKYGVMPLPMNSGDTVFYKAGGEGQVMTSTCDQSAAAATFMFWEMKPENAAIFAYGNGMPPANNEGFNYEPFKSDRRYDIIKKYLSIGKIYTVPFNPHLAEFRDTVVAPTLMDVAAGKTTFSDAMQLIQKQADLLLNQD